MRTTIFLRKIGRAIVLVAACAAAPAIGAPSQCLGHYAQDERPDLLNPALSIGIMELCNPGHATLYSQVSRTALWSAEHLSPGRLAAAQEVKRSDNFREDRRIPVEGRASLEDFRGSGYDRGHLAPSADMPTPAADAASFLLSNIIAQDPRLNRHQWRAIEAAVRAMARHRELYVITGVLFEGKSINRLSARVLIPSSVYKLVYDPQRNEASAWVVPNESDKRAQIINLQALSARAGIDFLPKATEVRPLKLARPRY